MAVLSALLLGIAAILCCLLVAVRKLRPSGSHKLLPGPTGLPLVGNMRQVVGGKPFITFTTWAKQFGEVFGLQLGQQKAIVISSIEAAKEAMVNKDFSGRPYFYTMAVAHGQEHKFVFGTHVDQMVKLYRKTVLGDIRRRQPALEPLVEGEVDKLTAELFPTTDTSVVVDLRNVLHKISTNIAYGYAFGTTLDLNSDLLTSWESSLGEYRELLFWFRWENFFPGASLLLQDYHIKAMTFRNKSVRLYKAGLSEARLRIQKKAEGEEGVYGLADTLLEAMADHDKDEEQTDQNVLSVLRDAMFACSDGAYQVLIWALVYVTREPALQRKIQQEIKDAIGLDRMPTLEDRDSLPYVVAFIREVLRYSEVATLGIPRRTVENTSLKNMEIEKDTLVIVNVYNIHRDPRHWEEPEKFNPERFLEKDGSLRNLSELSYLPFSTGNRSCVGQQLARGFLFLLITRFFQRLTVNTPPGDIIPDSLNQGGSFNPDVKPFKLLVEKVK